MNRAPLEFEVSEAPPSGEAFWCDTSDGLRLRIGFWRRQESNKGSILIFPGRTEYIEKYGRTIRELTDRGYSLLVIDWRGQGLSDRLSSDRRMGHIRSFDDYQKDVDAMMSAAETLRLSKPWHLFGHSMGATIGLRALGAGLGVRACAFTAPMWDIALPPTKKSIARPLAWGFQAFGIGERYAPGSDGSSYVLKKASTLEDRQIGGPSMGWLYQTLREASALTRIASPNTPCLTLVGSDDVVVDLERVKNRMAHWSRGTLVAFDGARHDLQSEVPAIRNDVFARIDKLFAV
jgi:lysophospholipase